MNFKINSRPLFTVILKLKNDNYKTRDFSPLIERILAGVTYVHFFSGEKNFFFHGNESSNHICKCFEDNTCPYEECNCNKYGSAQDSGIIRSEQLPITSMNYGPITTGEGMKFKAQIGDLKCSGTKKLICKYTSSSHNSNSTIAILN